MNRRDFLSTVAAAACGGSVTGETMVGLVEPPIYGVSPLKGGEPAAAEPVRCMPAIAGEGLFCSIPLKNGGDGLMTFSWSDVAKYCWAVVDGCVVVPDGCKTPQDLWNDNERWTKRRAFA